jgi:apolipoprotein N-acyltransferase
MNRKIRWSLAISSGVLLGLPWILSFAGPIVFIALVPLIILSDHLIEKQENLGKLPGYYFLSFLIWNLISTWWIVFATPIGMILVVFLNALFMTLVWGLGFEVKRLFGHKTGFFALTVFWLGFEYLQLNWEIQWPWLNLGNALANSVKMVQWSEYTGSLGGSLWILSLNFLLATVWQSYRHKKPWKVNVSVLLLVLIIPITISLIIYKNYSEKGKKIEVVVVQPNIDPYYEKFSALSPEEQVARIVHLADSLISPNTDYILSPETALPSLMAEDPVILKNEQVLPLKIFLDKHPHTSWITGAMTKRIFQKGDSLPETVRPFPGGEKFYDVYNAAIQIDTSLHVQYYHKSILVSGVEKMPFEKYLSFMENFILDLGGTSGSLGTQREPSNLTNKAVVAPLICYESVFGEYAGKFVKKGANVLFILTNDGWWKDTPGYKQHFAFARLRAIELRRSIARSANTGISGFINQRGDVVSKTSWWKADALNEEVSLNEKLTFYAVYGDYIGRTSIFCSALIVLFLIAQKLKLARKQPPGAQSYR